MDKSQDQLMLIEKKISEIKKLELTDDAKDLKKLKELAHEIELIAREIRFDASEILSLKGILD